MSDPTKWTSPAEIRLAVQRRWDNGTLPRGFAQGDPFPRIDVPLRAPTAADLGDYFDEARSWSDHVRRGSRDGQAYDIVEGATGGRLAGRTSVPQRAIIANYDQAWVLLGMGKDAAAYRQLIESASAAPPVRDWALAHPRDAIRLREDWHSVLAAYYWLETHRGSGLYLRQVSTPGVDTKFIERHRTVLAGMLGVSASAPSFVRALGLAERPATVRMRFDSEVFGLPTRITEATFRADELREWKAAPRSALIIENEISFLCAPVPPGSVVLWGKGFDVNVSASLDWLVGVPVAYWSDLDTHGFAMLDRVRAHLPTVRSVLMDRETLLAHEDRWGHEPKPTAALLPRLDTDETALYADLVSDRYARAVRLEQERIDWEWALERLAV